jgi:hypothetical protein
MAMRCHVPFLSSRAESLKTTVPGDHVAPLKLLIINICQRRYLPLGRLANSCAKPSVHFRIHSMSSEVQTGKWSSHGSRLAGLALAVDARSL